MRTHFHLTTGTRKPVNRLEAHLIAVAQQWAAGKGVGQFFTGLADFYEHLLKEKNWFLRDNYRIRATSVRIALSKETGLISIWPAERGADKPSLTIGQITITISCVIDTDLTSLTNGNAQE